MESLLRETALLGWSSEVAPQSMPHARQSPGGCGPTTQQLQITQLCKAHTLWPNGGVSELTLIPN